MVKQEKNKYATAKYRLIARFTNRRVIAQINEDRMAELLALTLGFMDCNGIPVKALRSFIGKAQSVASLLHVWRPFVAMLWGDLFDPGLSSSRAPPGCIWTHQVEEPLYWLKAFLTRQLDPDFPRNRPGCVSNTPRLNYRVTILAKMFHPIMPRWNGLGRTPRTAKLGGIRSVGPLYLPFVPLEHRLP